MKARIALVALLSVLSLIVAGLASYGPVSAQAGPGDDAPAADGAQSAAEKKPKRKPLGTLTVTPSPRYVAGQALTFTGKLRAKGKRKVWLEFHMERPGDTWIVVPGTRGRTKRNGSFRLVGIAPSMFDISYRVAGKGGWKTVKRAMDAPPQELSIWATESADLWQESHAINPVAGEAFTVVVDTTPEYAGAGTLKNLPILPGRRLTLQRKIDGERWETIGTSTVDSRGYGFLEVTEQAEGKVVYQVRQERIYTGKHRIGWKQSYPLALEVQPAGGEPTPFVFPERLPPQVNAPEPGRPHTSTAQAKYGWWDPLYDYGWAWGQDFSSPPSKGSSLRGSWIPYADGSGRASAHNGGIAVFSSINGRAGTQDFGTTRATLRGNAHRYGRWETRVRWTTLETRASDYTLKVELLPEGVTGDACDTDAIVLGSWKANSSTVTYGVAKGGQYWKRSKTIKGWAAMGPMLAVEVRADRITWFLNGQAVTTLPMRNGLGKPLAIRYSMEGGPGEYDTTKYFSDWTRAYPLGKGKSPVSKARPVSSASGFCDAS